MSHSATSWEESLEEIVNLADQNLAALERTKQSARGSAINRFQGFDDAKNPLASSYDSSSYRSRMVSGSRGILTESNQAFGYTNNNFSSFNQGRSYQQQEEAERKHELLTKKVKLLEEKIKKLEKDSSKTGEASEKNSESIKKILESHKADKKQVTALRDQVDSLKTRVELLLHAEQSREKLKSAPISGLDSETVNELVQKKMEKDFAKVLEEVVSACAKEQAAFLSKWTELAGAEKGQAASPHIIEAVSNMEKEIVKMKAEFDRMKSRQSSLDNIYNELRDGIAVREKRAEEQHKKAINSYKTEMETLVNTIGKRVNDALSGIDLHNNRDTALLNEQLSLHMEKSERVYAEIGDRLENMTEQLETVGGEVNGIGDELHRTTQRLSDSETLLKNVIAQCTRYNKLGDLADKHSEEISAQTEAIQALDFQVRAALEGVEANKVPIDLLVQSVDSINQKYQARTDSIYDEFKESHERLDREIEVVKDEKQKLSSKVKDLTDSVRNVAKTRQAVEAVLTEIDARSQDDASWSYQFRTAAQRLDYRLSQLEKARDAEKADLASDLEKLEEMARTNQSQLSTLKEEISKRSGDELIRLMNKSVDESSNKLRREIMGKVQQSGIDMELRCTETVLSISSREYTDGIKHLQMGFEKLSLLTESLQTKQEEGTMVFATVAELQLKSGLLEDEVQRLRKEFEKLEASIVPENKSMINPIVIDTDQNLSGFDNSCVGHHPSNKFLPPSPKPLTVLSKQKTEISAFNCSRVSPKSFERRESEVATPKALFPTKVVSHKKPLAQDGLLKVPNLRRPNSFIENRKMDSAPATTINHQHIEDFTIGSGRKPPSGHFNMQATHSSATKTDGSEEKKAADSLSYFEEIVFGDGPTQSLEQQLIHQDNQPKSVTTTEPFLVESEDGGSDGRSINSRINDSDGEKNFEGQLDLHQLRDVDNSLPTTEPVSDHSLPHDDKSAQQLNEVDGESDDASIRNQSEAANLEEMKAMREEIARLHLQKKKELHRKRFQQSLSRK